MKSVLLVNSNDDSENKEAVTGLFLEYLNSLGEVLVIKSAEAPFHEDFARMKAFCPDVIVSMNDAALDFVTEGGGCSLNRLPARVVHFLISSAAYSHFDTGLILNLSHAVSVCNEDVSCFSENHCNIPNVYGHSKKTEEMVNGLEVPLKELWCI